MLVIGIAATELAAQERDWLQHPAIGGVILFSRNFASRAQVSDLAASLRAASERPLLLCVDQEGGRVQRFRDGFVALPPLQPFAALHARDPRAALALAQEHAWLMANEILALGIDLSFAPVVDLGRGNRAIGNRAFAEQPELVAEFTRSYVAGMHEAGMAATLKHFPGHGSVLEDTHFDTAIDPRPLDVLLGEDLVPFVAGIASGAEAVMLAHVEYPAVAPEPAGYSPRWIGEILRRDLGFGGVVFSDDIGMAAAHGVGGVAARIRAHYAAGCDSVLVCAPDLVPDALDAMLDTETTPQALAPLLACARPDWDTLHGESRFLAASDALGRLASDLS